MVASKYDDGGSSQSVLAFQICLIMLFHLFLDFIMEDSITHNLQLFLGP